MTGHRAGQSDHVYDDVEAGYHAGFNIGFAPSISPLRQAMSSTSSGGECGWLRVRLTPAVTMPGAVRMRAADDLQVTDRAVILKAALVCHWLTFSTRG
jgi:hypothetical protein